ncbi:MAG: phage minor head protein [Gallionella sp.]|nr:phage minor head protein [Gallionella sp.]
MPNKLTQAAITFPQTLTEPRGFIANPFKEQVDFFRQKINLPSERWDDIWQAAHDKAFIVAGAMNADLVSDFRGAVDKAIHDGESLGEFRKRFDQIVSKNGWTGWTGEGSQAGRDWRTSIIYQTNLSTSYAAGRWAQLHDPDLIKMMPYLTYVHHDSRHPRPIHLSWNGFTAPRDHDFWKTHAVPNGWLCHCSIEAASEADYAAAKAAGKHEPPVGWDNLNPKTGEQVGIDKGFGYAPGASVNKPMKSFINQKLIKLDTPLRDALLKLLAPFL